MSTVVAAGATALSVGCVAGALRHRVIGGPVRRRRSPGLRPVESRWRRPSMRWGRGRGGEDGRELLGQLQSALQAGWSLAGALERAAAGPAPWSAELRAVLAVRVHGVPLHQVLDGWAARDPRPEVRALADATAVASTTGASLRAAVDAAATVAAEHRSRADEVRAATAQHRASAAVLVAVPVGFALVLAIVDPRVAQLLRGDPAGQALLAVGVLADVVGAGWLRHLVRSVR